MYETENYFPSDSIRVEKTRQGIYIINGKKVLVK